MIVGIHTTPYESTIKPVYEIAIHDDFIIFIDRASPINEESDKFINIHDHK